MIPVLARIDAVRAWREAARGEGRTVALVPTMGALHGGHLSLIDRARDEAEAVVVSVFVNPTQFGPGEDLESYPRNLDADLEASAARGAHAVFAPNGPEMYPNDQTIWVDPGPLAERLCGLSRPGHFRGVLTVVAKLLGIVDPDVAVFGRKDLQQSVLVRWMVSDLAIRARIAVADTVRDPDGLALSSRNAYLGPAERERALSLSRALRAVRAGFAAGERDPALLERVARSVLDGRVAAGVATEYAEIVRPDTLERPDTAAATDVCAIAARVGSTRLIDNETIGGPSALDPIRETGG